jgi:hypothetical protein
VEQPEETAALIREFAANASDADVAEPRRKRGDPRR